MTEPYYKTHEPPHCPTCDCGGEQALDTARLDWLADKDNPIGNVQLPSVCVMNNLHSMRAAIDEAMKLDRSIWNAVVNADNTTKNDSAA